MSLRRLLGLARLTPPQAVTIAADLLTDLATAPAQANADRPADLPIRPLDAATPDADRPADLGTTSIETSPGDPAPPAAGTAGRKDTVSGNGTPSGNGTAGSSTASSSTVGDNGTAANDTAGGNGAGGGGSGRRRRLDVVVRADGRAELVPGWSALPGGALVAAARDGESSTPPTDGALATSDGESPNGAGAPTAGAVARAPVGGSALSLAPAAPFVGPELVDVSEALEELARSVGATPGAGEAEVAELEQAARALAQPDPALAVVAARLRRSATDPPAARAELARLVAAVHHRGVGEPPPAVPDRGPAPPVPRRPPLRLLARSWKALLTLAVLAVFVAVEVVLLDDRIAQGIGTVLDAGRSAPVSAAPTGPPPAPAPAPPPEPAAAGAVLAVDARAVGACTPGKVCQLRVAVLLAPAPQQRTVEWSLRSVDRCTGATTGLPGGSVAVAPGGDRADAVQTVALPAGQALAVTAVTSSPAVAASRPLPVPATASCQVVPPSPSGGN